MSSIDAFIRDCVAPHIDRVHGEDSITLNLFGRDPVQIRAAVYEQEAEQIVTASGVESRDSLALFFQRSLLPDDVTTLTDRDLVAIASRPGPDWTVDEDRTTYSGLTVKLRVYRQQLRRRDEFRRETAV